MCSSRQTRKEEVQLPDRQEPRQIESDFKVHNRRIRKLKNEDWAYHFALGLGVNGVETADGGHFLGGFGSKEERWGFGLLSVMRIRSFFFESRFPFRVG